MLAHTCTDIARLEEHSSSPVSHTNTIKRIMCRCGNLGWRTSHAEHTHASTQLRPLDECELRYLERKTLGFFEKRPASKFLHQIFRFSGIFHFFVLLLCGGEIYVIRHQSRRTRRTQSLRIYGMFVGFLLIPEQPDQQVRP